MAARPNLNEVEYAAESVTLGSYSGLDTLNMTVRNFGFLMLGRPSLNFSMLPMLRINAGMQEFLDRNALWPALDVAEKLRGELERKVPVRMSVFVEKDSEAQDREELVLCYSIRNISYDEILQLWNQASRTVHDSLPSPLAERVYVRLTKA
jgi:hypothetical protein